ncbi:MTH1187 family thiamine-binding protein [Dietzia sp. CH92]|uniref:MTH1187 family thiamine-binding protein n=1 Tax=Dietzia sp. CH92 TaxID=3051823 RepID=UPI0028D2DDD4|nr:MTH1187 family thiamine-binding protein [Dietzia sp. CH92]
MLFAFSIAPTSTADESASMSKAVAEAVRVVRESGLPHETTSMFTTVEGEWDEVMPVIRAATDAVLAVSPRVSLVLKADLRPGRSGELRGKVERVERHLAGGGGGAPGGGGGAGVTGEGSDDDEELHS